VDLTGELAPPRIQARQFASVLDGAIAEVFSLLLG
jgi:hypothetical protein